MNEFTKDSPTSEKLVAELGTKTDITICADIVHGLDYEYKHLQQKNQELKNLNRIYEEIISDDEENYKLLSSEIKQLGNQQKEIIDKAKEYIKSHKRNLINEITHEEYEVLDDENIINLLEILDNKGE